MTTTAVFDGTNLVNASPYKPTFTSTESFEITIDCITSLWTDVTAIKAKAGICKKTTLLSGKTAVQTTGTKGSLVIAGDTYTFCAIENGIQVSEVPGTANQWWKYSMKFVQDTS